MPVRQAQVFEDHLSKGALLVSDLEAVEEEREHLAPLLLDLAAVEGSISILVQSPEYALVGSGGHVQGVTGEAQDHLPFIESMAIDDGRSEEKPKECYERGRSPERRDGRSRIAARARSACCIALRVNVEYTAHDVACARKSAERGRNQ